MTLQESSRVVTKKSHMHNKLQSNLIERLMIQDTRLFMILSSKDRDERGID